MYKLKAERTRPPSVIYNAMFDR